ncbi:LOW QUALITY PROTEIN: uncharacterized protein LOC129617280 [Condylostylus longicornis]|uniref:LOW QUALITY PROTEIN: uncharacterized protein LOC129617280 n=1 Tax=Condylostylus longicornis TaxID=2530218 RepID=UPI00244D9D55|nr:LOW QUALITY PROTEIN: uncharacterized protein LOC129617280 [Condylostylus longicornis]
MAAGGLAGTAQPASSSFHPQAEEVYQFILDLTISSKRERALLELSRRRESFPDLAPILWHSFGVVTSVIQEIISIYPQLSPPTLTSIASNRVCNALALLQCVASHPDTRHHFLNAHIPLFLYPFLNTVSVSRPFEYLRLTSLGVIGALVKVDDHEVIGFLLQTEIISLCLRIMEMGSELSKTVATFIVQKILLDELGLRYVCATAERFYALSSVLGGMVQNLIEQPSPRLIKHIIKCYLRLADNPRAREALKRCLPEALRHSLLLNIIKDDPTTKQNIATLVDLVDNTPAGQLFEISSATDLLTQAQKQQKLQQHQLQQTFQGVSLGSTLQPNQTAAFQQPRLQQTLQTQPLSGPSLLGGSSGLDGAMPGQ